MENPESLSGVVPPHSNEAEVSVLGAMLQESQPNPHGFGQR